MPVPRLVVPPRLDGPPRLGQALVADPGRWQGAEVLALQWCRNGRPIPGATGRAYRPEDADDGALLSLRVTARAAAGAATAESPALRAVCEPPAVLPLVFDEVLDAGTGPQQIPVAAAFRGQALRFSATGGGASVDPLTGMVTVPTDRPHAGHDVTVTARNSGGAESLVFRVTVEDEGEDEGELAETEVTDTLAVDGVTFRFATPVETGHFITGAAGAGDPFVIGPVTLTDYDPAPAVLDGRAVNGAMLNPPVTRDTGFDGLAPRDTYDPELNAGLRLPLRLVPGDSLVVAVSIERPEKDGPHIRRFVVLTCLAEVPFADSFRPPYSGPEKPLYRWSDLDTGLLASLPVLGRSDVPNPAELARRFDRFALDIVPNWNKGGIAAAEHPPTYGRDLGQDQAAPLIWINADVPLSEKAPVIAGLVQRGIDRFGIVEAALAQGTDVWGADGGHNFGRKITIMVAGHLLGVAPMREVARHAAPQVVFQEDATTFYVTPEIVALTNGPDWSPSYGDKRPQQPYAPGMVGMPDWRGKPDPASASASWVHNPYRYSATHNAQHGQVLAALAMGLKEAWGHDAYFDYHVRYSEIMRGAPDPWRFRGGDRPLYDPVTGSRPAKGFPEWQLYWQDPWSWRMLSTYRFELDPLPWMG